MCKTARLLVVGALLLVPVTAAAQRLSPEAERATLAYRKGWELMRLEAFGDAARQFQEAISIDRKFALAYYSLGRAHMALKQFNDAIKDYLACQSLYLARAGEEFSSQMEANKYRDEQIQQYREILRQANITPGTVNRNQTQTMFLAHVQDDLRQLEQAKQRNMAVSLSPEVPFFVSLSLGAAYFRSDRFLDAEREYKTAIASNGNSGEAHNNLAVLYLTTGRLDEAAAEIAAAEKTGYKVNPGLKDELKQKMGKARGGRASPGPLYRHA